MPLWKLLLILLFGVVSPAHAREFMVAATGGDFSRIQDALEAAVAGDTVTVRAQPVPYFEKIHFPRSGNASAGPITLRAFPGEQPILDGTGVVGSDMVRIDSRSWVRLIGFEIRNNLGVNDGSGVRILGSGSHIEIRDNRIHDIRGRHAMGITVYGTESDPISALVIDGNEIHDCEPFRSEALTLNGNVTDFEVTHNLVRDVNNIGIDFIGGETDIQPDRDKVARNGVCRGNVVLRANEKGGGYAGGIYVDGARDIIIENNVVSESDLGIEVGAENRGTDARNIVVRSNVLFANKKACLVFGGFEASVGRVRNSLFSNNTCYKNDTAGMGIGELWIQYALNNRLRGNLFYSTSQNLLVYSESGNVNNALDYNLFFTAGDPATAGFTWKNQGYSGFAAYGAATGQDAHSIFSDPQLVDPPGGDFHLRESSPAINAGDPSFVPDPGETDLDGAPRLSGPRVDLGADEATCGDGVVSAGEECDDGNALDGDGCDSNCRVTACGNGITTIGEGCDDGNLEDGDCCSSSCQPVPDGVVCSDADPCTTRDACIAGFCGGRSEPRTLCREPSVAGKSTFLLRDRAVDRSDRLTWTWKKGPSVRLEDLGDPLTGSTSYTLCIYDEQGGVSRLVARASIAPGGMCGGTPCWRASGQSGYRFKDRERRNDGIGQLVLRAGEPGRASLRLSGKGEHLHLPLLPLDQDSHVTVQLQNSQGACWSARYNAPALRNQADQFKDRND